MDSKYAVCVSIVVLYFFAVIQGAPFPGEFPGENDSNERPEETQEYQKYKGKSELELFNDADTNGDGNLTVDEIVHFRFYVYKGPWDFGKSKDQIREDLLPTFEELDKDNNAQVSLQEVKDKEEKDAQKEVVWKLKN